MTDNEKEIGIEEVIQYLPHRYPFLMIDRVLSYEKGQSLIALKNVTVNEPYFTGHFPDNPVMPGVMIVEALAQAGAILAYISTQSKPSEFIFLLASVEQAKFKHMVVPGDQLKLEVKLVGSKAHFWKIQGEASVNGKLACSVNIMSAMRKI